MAQESFSMKVLSTVLALASKNHGEAEVSDISTAIFARTYKEHYRILDALSEHFVNGRLRRIREGVYAPLESGDRRPDKREVMWRLLRMRRKIKVEDLVEMADVSPRYAREWLRMLVRRQIVRKIQRPGFPGIWFLIKDSLEMPQDSDKATRLRKNRCLKKIKTEIP